MWIAIYLRCGDHILYTCLEWYVHMPSKGQYNSREIFCRHFTPFPSISKRHLLYTFSSFSSLFPGKSHSLLSFSLLFLAPAKEIRYFPITFSLEFPNLPSFLSLGLGFCFPHNFFSSSSFPFPRISPPIFRSLLHRFRSILFSGWKSDGFCRSSFGGDHLARRQNRLRVVAGNQQFQALAKPDFSYPSRIVRVRSCCRSGNPPFESFKEVDFPR